MDNEHTILPHTWQNCQALGFDWQKFYSRLVQEAAPGDSIVELGVAWGQSLVYLSVEAHNSGKDLRLFGIDLFNGSRSVDTRDRYVPGTCTYVAEKNLRDAGTRNWTLILDDTTTSAYRFSDASLFAVFVDAAHQEDSTLRTIDNWWPKVRPGGYLCGHDWSPRWEGVVRAVQARFAPEHIEVTSNFVWAVKKPHSCADSVNLC